MSTPRPHPVDLLVDLDPQWVEENGSKVSIMFECPFHSDCNGDGGPRWIGADFANSIGDATSRRGWSRTGETFETLSLSPSIRVMNPGVCEWHGYVTDGRVITLGDSR